MTCAAASEVAGDFDKWHDKAMHEPVVITSHGQESAVLLRRKPSVSSWKATGRSSPLRNWTRRSRRRS
jgi:PHD/YefM family antitoxin component YafN of YafNO toxin-antitoxin module